MPKVQKQPKTKQEKTKQMDEQRDFLQLQNSVCSGWLAAGGSGRSPGANSGHSGSFRKNGVSTFPLSKTPEIVSSFHPWSRSVDLLRL